MFHEEFVRLWWNMVFPLIFAAFMTMPLLWFTGYLIFGQCSYIKYGKRVTIHLMVSELIDMEKKEIRKVLNIIF